MQTPVAVVENGHISGGFRFSIKQNKHNIFFQGISLKGDNSKIIWTEYRKSFMF